MMHPWSIRKGFVFLMGLFLLAVSPSAKADDDRIRVTQVQTDYVAKTLTITVADLDKPKHLAAPKVRLAGSPLVILNSVVTNIPHTAPATPTLPTPSPPV